jgi:hypothetical protein
MILILGISKLLGGAFSGLFDNLLARPLRTGFAEGTFENLAFACTRVALTHFLSRL